jgi:uncharacterized protein (TIRG00374 family)
LTKSSISSVSAPRSSARALRWPGLVGVAISVALLWWALHDVRPADVARELQGVRIWPLLGAVVLATVAFPVRAVRWRYLLRLDGATLPLRPLWHATAIGFMANNLLPARAGEVARAYAARRLLAVRFTTAAASIAIERIFDGLVLVALFAGGAWAGGFAPGTVLGGVTLGGLARGAALVFGVALVAAIVIVHRPAIAVRTTRRIVGLVASPRVTERIVGFVQGAISGLDALKSPGRFSVVLFWSVVNWVTVAASFWLGFVAFGIGLPGSAPLVLLGVVAFGVAIPSSPGFFGVFEAAVRIALGLYGVDAARAVPFALGYHLTTFIPITLLGIWSLSRAHLHLAELRKAGQTEGREDGKTE